MITLTNDEVGWSSDIPLLRYLCEVFRRAPRSSSRGPLSASDASGGPDLRPLVSKRKRSSRCVASPRTPKVSTRAAANSIASGIPSSFRQISATIGALSSSRLVSPLGTPRFPELALGHQTVVGVNLLGSPDRQSRQQDPIEEADKTGCGDRHRVCQAACELAHHIAHSGKPDKSHHRDWQDEAQGADVGGAPRASAATHPGESLNWGPEFSRDLRNLPVLGLDIGLGKQVCSWLSPSSEPGTLRFEVRVPSS